MKPNITICKTPEDVALAACDKILSLPKNATVALSGGSTAILMYKLLADNWQKYSDHMESTHLFWVDERCVLQNSKRSNFGEASRQWLDKVDYPQKLLHRMRGELEPEKAAILYERELRETFGKIHDGQIVFDLVFLGMGEDGHTASLFPNSPALLEKEKMVTANTIPETGERRLTLTYPCINAAREIVFVVTGANKAQTVREVMDGKHPASKIKNAKWLIDEAAAELV